MLCLLVTILNLYWTKQNIPLYLSHFQYNFSGLRIILLNYIFWQLSPKMLSSTRCKLSKKQQNPQSIFPSKVKAFILKEKLLSFMNLTFIGPCIVIYSYNKSQRDALFLKFSLVENSKCFGQIYCPSSGVSTLYTHQ